jgi:hypothetical protein
MVTLFVRHPVADFAAWHKVYESVAPLQKAGGVTSESVWQSVDDAGDVTVVHEFKTLAEARAFMANAELKAAMMNGGVTAPPTVWFAEKR